MILMSGIPQINGGRGGVGVKWLAFTAVLVVLSISCSPRVADLGGIGLNPVEVLEDSPRVYRIRFESFADSIETQRAAAYLTGSLGTEFTTGPGPRLAQDSYTAKAYVNYKLGDEGVLYAAGDNTGGYALYIQEEKLKFHYNWLSFKHFHIDSDIELPEGELELAFDFVLTRSRTGVGRLLINGRPSGNVYIESQPLFLGGSFGIGKFPFVSVTGDMKEKKNYPYTNHIDRVEFNLERPIGDMELILELEQALRNE